METQGSPTSPGLKSLNDNLRFEMKDHQRSCAETLPGIDPSPGVDHQMYRSVVAHKLKKYPAKFRYYRGNYIWKKQVSYLKHLRSLALMFGMMGFFFMLDSVIVSTFHSTNLQVNSTQKTSSGLKDNQNAYHMDQKLPARMYDRLLSLASSALAEKEFGQDPSSFWEEPHQEASLWKPCSEKKGPPNFGRSYKDNGFLLISANGGLNQQRVAICNSVALASLLNATLVLPRFLYSNVWKDPSQFGDIYQEDYFIDVLKDDVNIVKDLPPQFKSLDMKAIGSLITDADIVKEAKPVEYIEKVLPLLQQNGVVHFLGFGNRLGFDPFPLKLQRLRCKCNFHALNFVTKIQQAGSLLVKRIRKYDVGKDIMLDKQLLGNFAPEKAHDASRKPSRYLALHLRFEIDMVAYSQCNFGGGESERKELQAYREAHFPLFIKRLKNSKVLSPAVRRKLGRCPLTPEEAALVLAALGFERGTQIYLAGSRIYGGRSRMDPLTRLYPNLATKEDLLTPTELAPFMKFSSQLAALDFIASATADVFAMTDSGSQLSSLVSGFRTYYGGGRAPALRPNKKRLAAILSENSTIGWNTFEDRVRKMIEEGQRVRSRGFGRSIYRHPRSPECMCKITPMDESSSSPR